jgi:chitodextrinase
VARKVTIRRGLKADLPLLDIGELGFAIDTQELYIGSEIGNVLFAKRSELEGINTEIYNIQQSPIFTRLGISENGLLTIDGVEISSGGGNGELTLIVKDYFEGSADITKTYSSSMIGFEISNDAPQDGNSLTFTINGLTIPVKASEVYSANFAPFKQVKITSTSPYRATVSAAYGASTTADNTAPENVTGLTVSNISSSGLTLIWNASVSEDTTGYEIYRDSILITTVTETTYSFTGLSASTQYAFTVKAKDGSGNIAGGTSVTASTTATLDTTAPNNVTNLTTSNITASSVTLSWTASTSSDVSGYDIYNGASFVTTVTGTTYNASGLNANTNYTFNVKAKDNSNNIASGTSVTFTTSAVADTTPPNNVTNLNTNNLTDRSVNLSWTASSSSDVASYEIYNGASLITSTTNTSYTVTGLAQSTNYTLTVKAKDGAGNISTGTSVSFTTLATDVTAPNEVTNLSTSNITQTSLTLGWTASTSSDIASYDIYNGSTFLANVTGTTYSVSGLTASTQYTFYVKAKDLSGNVSSGAGVTATTSGATAYALQMNGTSDYLKTPAITWDSVEIEYSMNTVPAGTNYLFFASTQSYITANGGKGTNIKQWSIDGEIVGSKANTVAPNISIIPVNDRVVIKVDLVSALTNNTCYLFSGNSGTANWMNGNISKITFYSNSVVVSRYDMSTGTVTDKSGNGKDAILTGGSWIAEPKLTISISPLDKKFATTQNVTLTPKKPTATIYYTVDGTTPTTASSVYSSPIAISTTKTLKYFAVNPDDGSSTIVASKLYSIDTLAPNNVTNLTGTSITSSSLTLSWTASNSSDVVGYDIYKDSILIGSTTTVVTYDVTGLSPSTSYSFVIKAKDDVGNVNTGTSYTVSTTA